MRTIFVAGYPKSGTTWMTRLLGDILDCPTGGQVASADKKEIASEGRNRNGNFVVRKGHFSFNHDKDAPLSSKNHKLGYGLLQPNQTVFIVRDPRDIAVSGAHHWNVSVKAFAENMITGTGGVRSFPPWDKYIYSWTDISKKYFPMSYENLHDHWQLTLVDVMDYLGLDISRDVIQRAYARQRFHIRKQHIKKHGNSYPLGKALNLRFMRKGIVGDWKKNFPKTVAIKFNNHFGAMMHILGYIEKGENWWKNLK